MTAGPFDNQREADTEARRQGVSIRYGSMRSVRGDQVGVSHGMTMGTPSRWSVPGVESVNEVRGRGYKGLSYNKRKLDQYIRGKRDHIEVFHVEDGRIALVLASEDYDDDLGGRVTDWAEDQEDAGADGAFIFDEGNGWVLWRIDWR